VVDRWRAVATALDELSNRKPPVADLEEQGLRGVEDRATGFGSTLASTFFSGMHGHRRDRTFFRFRVSYLPEIIHVNGRKEI